MKIKYLLPISAIAILCACGSDNDDLMPNNGNGNSESAKQEKIENEKQNLERVAKNISKLFKPEDQKELVNLSQDFANLYGELDIPTQWENLFNDSPSSAQDLLPGRFLNLISKGYSYGDATALTRASSTYVYTYKLSQISGIYKPNRNTGRWYKTGNSSSVIFQFNDAKGLPCELKITGEGGETKFSFYDAGEHNVFIPGNVTVSLTRKDNSLIKCTINSSKNGSNYIVDSEITCMNLYVNEKASASNNSCNATLLFTVSGQELLNLEASATGNNITNFDYWDSYNTDEIFRTAKAKGNILNQLTLDASINFTQRFFKAMDSWYCETGLYYFDVRQPMSKEEALEQINKDAAFVNNSGYIRLKNTGGSNVMVQVAPKVVKSILSV